ncbi:MAG: endonuclease [Candidatus Izemoplasmatales bacterium]
MKLKKLLIVLIMIIFSFTVISCAQETSSTTASNSTTTTKEITTTITTTQTSISTSISTSQVFEGIEVTEVKKTEYEYNEDFDKDSITVIITLANGQQMSLRNDMYSISGFDSSIPGETTVTVTYEQYQDTFIVTILPVQGIEITMPYYLSASGLAGNALFLELREIINEGFSPVSYGESRYILDETDKDPNNPNNIILVYLGTSISGKWDAGATWNREHVWPQSLLGLSVDNPDKNMGSDLQNLKPANPSENTSRSNRYYDNISVGGLSYEPRDEVKGDLARILLYMWTMYDVLELVDYDPNTYQMALLSVLLQWHEIDPVDDFERNRNEVIYSYQKNRNPYIDYPEFVDLIWGEN